MSRYLAEDARNALASRVIRGHLFTKYKLGFLRKELLRDVVDPGMTWGDFEDEMAIIAYGGFNPPRRNQ